MALGCTVDDFYTWPEDELARARAAIGDYQYADVVLRNLSRMPPLSDAQLARLAILLRPDPGQISA